MCIRMARLEGYILVHKWKGVIYLAMASRQGPSMFSGTAVLFLFPCMVELAAAAAAAAVEEEDDDDIEACEGR